MRNVLSNIFFLFALVGTTLLTACSSFLEAEQQDEVVVKTVSDYGELLLGSGYPSPRGNHFNVLYLLDDDMQMNDAMLDNESDYAGALSIFPFHTWQPKMWSDTNVDETKYMDLYGSLYSFIMATNAVLDGIDDAVGDKNSALRVKAEALALRGYYYFMLTNLFGEPYGENPLSLAVPLKLSSSINMNGMPRNTVTECYGQITKDLEEAVNIFEQLPVNHRDYHFNLPSAAILLSRVFLHMGEWDKVEKYSTIAIDNGGAITNYNNEGTSTKSCSQYAYSEVELLFGDGNNPNKLTCMQASSDLQAQFSDDDNRKNLWFDKNGNVYKHRLPNTGLTPTMTIRTSEAWLNRAEARAQNGNLSEASDDLKHLQAFRYKNVDSGNLASKDELLESIRHERRCELCFEEVRWFDLRRYGKPSISHQFKTRKNAQWQIFVLKEKDPLYTLPFPDDAIMENPSLIQNNSAKQAQRIAE